MNAARSCAAIVLAAFICVGAAAAPGREEQAVRASQGAIGQPVGDWALVDQTGRTLHLADLRDRPLVVSFIYTGCFQVCPASTQFLKKAVAETRAALGASKFRVLSIGFNQPFDTPEALAAFARKQSIDDPDWLFAAPRAQDVPALLARFGFSAEPTAGGFDHLVQTSIVDTGGILYRQVYGDAFELPMFVGPLKELLSGTASHALTLDNVWTKIKLYCTVYDPASGRYRFDYSLFVELFAGLTTFGALGWFLLRELRRTRSGARQN